MKRPRLVKDPLFLTLLISMSLHILLVFPFWRFRTLHLTVPERPLRMVLEIPLTEPVDSVEPPSRVNKMSPHQQPTREKPVVKPIAKPIVKPPLQPVTQPKPLLEKPAVKAVEQPEVLHKSIETAKTVVSQPEVKSATPVAEPVNQTLPQPDQATTIVNQVPPSEVNQSVAPQVESKPAPPAERSALSSAYMRTLIQKIQNCKRYPRLARDRGIEGEALIEFFLAGDGKLLDARVIRSSGFTILDKEALLTIRRASPFPKLPEGTLAGQVVLKVTINFALLD
jgi:protein TonB